MPGLDELCRKPDLKSRAYCALARGLLALRPETELDERHAYVVRLEDNLLGGLTRADLEAEFGGAAGRELERKMRAPWSSSALAVNAFWPWKRSADVLELAGWRGYASEFLFERPCPNGVSSIDSHPDLVLEHGRTIVAVESKCTEHLTPKRKSAADKWLGLATAGDPRAHSRWYAALAQLSEFSYLDAYQLIKHFMGLRWTFPGQPLHITYLYWEPTNAAEHDVFAQHRKQVARFSELVAGDKTCGFDAVTHDECWRKFESADDPPDWLPSRLAELRARYAVGV